ncbi:MAG: hypothetical protein COY56_05830 [Flavobacteriaceae bacterium CG_4_10_14_0_8_um_filter_34_31]|nr:MAG: hypothetical protein COY56_05830 [Flavobacteriaceae bacterium CG_4_10_14_0_8_um_filter_34_31]
MKYKYIIPYVMCLLFVTQITYTQNLKKAIAKIDTYHKELTNSFQKENTKKYTEKDFSNWVITSDHVSSTSGVHHIYYRQTYNGIEVYGAEASMHIASNGSIISKNNDFIPSLEEKIIGGKSPSLNPLNAVMAAAAVSKYKISENLKIVDIVDTKNHEFIVSKGGISSSEIPVKLMYQQNKKGDVVLVWNLSIDDIQGQNWFSYRINASTGELVDKNDWQVNCNLGENHDHSLETEYSTNSLSKEYEVVTMEESLEEYYALLGGSYRVYAMPIESPNHGSRTLVTGVENLTASPYGWHDTNGAPGVEYTISRGNNVYAYDDIANTNNPGTTANGGGSLNFDFPINTTWSAGNRSLPAAITNLFYWSNIIHDVVYQYGFDEASGNFQQNNYGNGGSQNDYVRAEAQDGSGTCNANFATPNDGSLPRMQMYVCNSRDGDLDNGVVVHEYGHGISNRLTGGRLNSGCLANSEQMGEGWSDYYALLFTMKSGDSGPASRGIGTWLVGQAGNGPGIREFPYSTNMAINSHTYSRTQTAVVPHGVGSVWAMMLYEMTWGLIDQYGFDPDIYNGTGGNNISLSLVTEALKLQPCSPGFVSGRDAILAADIALYNGANQCIIWAAFAKRGLGFSATQGSTNSNADNIQAFDLPPTSFNAPTSFCVTEGVQSGLSGGTPGGGVYSGPGVTDDGNGSTYSFNPFTAGEGSHTIIYTSSCGGSASDTILVTAAPAAPSITNDTFCAGDSVTLTATPNDINNTIEWYDATNGGNLLFTGNSYTFSPVGTTSVYAEEVLSPIPVSITVSHSNSQDIGTGSVACGAGAGAHTTSSYWRVFNLSGSFGITDDFNVNQVQFGLQSITSNFTATVRLHSLSGAFTTSNLTLLASQTVNVAPANNGSVISVPMSVTIPAGTIVVMEVFTPAQAGNLFMMGSNPNGENAPSYISAVDCGINQPSTLASIGFPNIHYVMNIIGEGSVANPCTGLRAEATATADNIPPIAIAQDFTVFLDVNGQATISSSNINNGSSDNCGIASMSVSPNFFNCASIGNQIVTLTVTDTEGNINTAQANVTVIDNLMPNIGTASNQTVSGNVNCQATLANYTSLVLATDNCGSPTITQNPPAGTLITGTTTVTLTATDASGNFDTTTFNVIIEDTTNPTINTIADQSVSGDAACQGLVGDYSSLAFVSDNCDATPVVSQSPAAGTVFSGTTSVTVTVTDASGNFSSTSFDVVVLDVINPTIDGIADRTVVSNTNCEANLPDYTFLANVLDNCDASPLITQFPNPGTVFSGSILVTITATDTSGNASSTSFNVTVIDVIAPEIICPENMLVIPDENGNFILPDVTSNAIVFDNCTISPMIFQSPAAGTIFTEGSINTITLIATDDAGNISECTFVIEVDVILSTIDSVLYEEDVIIYPSPANNFFRIQYNGNLTLTKLELFDIRGRSISTHLISYEGNNLQFDVSKLANGVYWVNIFAEKEKIIKRLIIENK